MAVKDNGGGPLDYNIGTTTSNATNSWKKGDVIDIRNYLFTKYRDYLIRSDHQTHVKAEQLAGKVIILYFVSLKFHPHQHNDFTLDLKYIYNYPLQSHHGIEIVLVAVDDVGNESLSEKRFKEIFSRMPWTAIPLSDLKCRKKLGINFKVNKSRTLIVVDSTGEVLHIDAEEIIMNYGALGFPFSDERIEQLSAEEDADIERPSLMSLLGSSQRDYLITNKEEKVPIRTLEDKVVGLYFYDGYSASCAEHIRTVYEELAKTKENFEIVLIYVDDTLMHTYERSFWKVFKTMPWLALPFKDPSINRLVRIFEYYPEDEIDDLSIQPALVIFGPHGEFIEPLGYSVSRQYQLYPFTIEIFAKSEAEKVENLKMEMLWHPDTVFTRTDGLQMRFSELGGKRVIHFFERKYDDYPIREFLMKLKEKYLESKGGDEEFEVIHILEDARMKEDARRKRVALPIHDLPWFVSLASELLPADHGYDFYNAFNHYCGNSVLLAFDRDGKLVRRTVVCTFADPEFPFFSSSLEEESLSQLINMHKWDYWNCYYNKGLIYTLPKKLQKQHLSHSNYPVWRIIKA